MPDLPAAKGYYLGWVGHGNLGDEVMFKAAKSQLDWVSWNIYYGAKAEKVKTEIKTDKNHTFCGILGGGTLINSGVGWLTQYCSLSMSLYKVIPVFGTGVADPEFWTGRQGWKDHRNSWTEVLKQLDRVGVRGPRSVELLNEVGLNNVKMVGDPAILFAINRDPKRQLGGKVVVNVGTALGNMWGGESNIISTTVKLVHSIQKLGHKVILVSVWGDDTKTLIEIASKCKGVDIFETKDFGAFYAVTQDADALIGMKLHAQILSCCYNIPTIFLEYMPKCRDFAESLGYKTIRTDEYSAARVLAELDYIYSDMDEYRTQLLTKVSSLKTVFYNYCYEYLTPSLIETAQKSLWIK